MSTLDDPGLHKDAAFIGGEWVPADSGESVDVIDPATGEKVGSAPKMGAAETERAIAAAAKAQPAWAARTAKDRSDVLRRFANLLMEHQQDLAVLMTREQGKPLTESRGEIAYAASFLEWFSEEARRAYGEVIPAHQPDLRIVVQRQPIGVGASITPWNFPAAMITRKLGPALAAGCTMVAKPAESTPLSALALAELATRAGVPAGAFNVVTGDRDAAAAIGGALTGSSTVRKLSFTGSTAVGKKLYEQCAGTVKNVSLELGGNAPFLVFDDADLEAAVDGCMASKFRNAGQTCVCANRIYVQAGIYDRFRDALAARIRDLRVGPGLEEGVQIGPLIEDKGLEKVMRLVADARDRGAEVVVGGGKHELGGTFHQPTLLTGVTPEMDMANEEIFGPVAGLIRFEDEAEAVASANDTPYGLAAYFYSRDVGRSFRVAEQLEYGMVGVNTGMISTTVAPFGGIKESGLGREGSHHGLEEWTELKYMCMGGIEPPARS